MMKQRRKGDFSKEQIAYAFGVLDSEDDGMLSIQNIIHGFHSIKLPHKINPQKATKMVRYANQPGNAPKVSLSKFIALCSNIGLCDN